MSILYLLGVLGGGGGGGGGGVAGPGALVLMSEHMAGHGTHGDSHFRGLA